MRTVASTLALLTLAFIGLRTSSTSPLAPTRLATASGAGTTARQPTNAPIPSPTLVSSIWQVQSIVLSGHLGWIGNLAWSPDGNILASASGDYIAHDKTARLWQSDGTPVAILSAHTAEVYALAWSPDGRVLATGAGDGTVRLWQSNGTLVKTLNSEGTVFGLSWSPDGKSLTSGASVYLGQNPIKCWTAD